MKFTFLRNNFLFWQPKTDWFKKISQYKLGNHFLVFLNYIIWIFLFYVSYLLIKKETNVFWQLFTATILGEAIEKILKIKSFWKRPMHIRNNVIPDGLLKSWYQKGSFPSGHAIKSTFFLLFILQYSINMSSPVYLLVVLPLVLVRVFLGLHYPIDVIGGILLGIIIWVPVHFFIFPDFLVNFIGHIFNFIFLIK